MKNKLIGTLILIASTVGIMSCTNNNGPKKATFVDVKPMEYQDVNVETDMAKFFNETKKQSGSSWDNPLDYGFVKSVWHTLALNDVEIPVYSTRCGKGIHSFAYVNVDTDGAFELKADVALLEGKYKNAIILPEKAGVNVTIEKSVTKAPNHYKFTLKDYGDYSLCFGSETKIAPYQALTIYIAKDPKDVVPEGYQVVEVQPGTYDDDDATLDKTSLRFSQAKTYYRFKSGVYSTNSILIPDDSIFYFEPGCYIKMRQDDNKPGVENAGKKFQILGRALFDWSNLMGGDSKTKVAYNFVSATEGAHVEGILSINSNTWTMMYTACDKLEICYNMLFGYRTYSDGIMLSGCSDSYVHHNFVRTGDDAIEAKATSPRKLERNNLLYEYNTVWTDKAKAYGVIYESNANVTGITFRHNSIGFAQPDWHGHVGCLEMQMGTEYDVVWSDIHFEDIEIYYSCNSIMNIWNAAANIYSYGDPAAARYGGTIKDIYYKDIRVAHLETTNSAWPAYMLSIDYIVDSQHPEYVDHLKLGKLYIDNVKLGDVKMEKTNYNEYSCINLPEDFTWSTGNIKWNTNPEVPEVTNPLLG